MAIHAVEADPVRSTDRLRRASRARRARGRRRVRQPCRSARAPRAHVHRDRPHGVRDQRDVRTHEARGDLDRTDPQDGRRGHGVPGRELRLRLELGGDPPLREHGDHPPGDRAGAPPRRCSGDHGVPPQRLELVRLERALPGHPSRRSAEDAVDPSHHAAAYRRRTGALFHPLGVARARVSVDGRAGDLGLRSEAAARPASRRQGEGCGPEARPERRRPLPRQPRATRHVPGQPTDEASFSFQADA